MQHKYRKKNQAIYVIRIFCLFNLVLIEVNTMKCKDVLDNTLIIAYTYSNYRTCSFDAEDVLSLHNIYIYTVIPKIIHTAVIFNFHLLLYKKEMYGFHQYSRCIFQQSFSSTTFIKDTPKFI